MDCDVLDLDFDAVLADGTFVEMNEHDGLAIDLRYASSNNFLGRDLYGSWNRLILHRIAAEKLWKAIALLGERRPDWRLLVFDGSRPNRIQRIFWDVVHGTPQEIYVADPALGSIHAFGLAIDLSLVDKSGNEIDMGTGFDDFTPLAEPRREAALVASGLLSERQVGNRDVLRSIMTSVGFYSLPIEWWHYDALPPDEVRGHFTMVL